MFCSSLFIFFLDIYYNKYIIFRFPIPQLRLLPLLDIWEISSPPYYKGSVYLALECTSISKRRYSSKNLVNLIKITWNCLLFSVELISEFLLQALILSINSLILSFPLIQAFNWQFVIQIQVTIIAMYCTLPGCQLSLMEYWQDSDCFSGWDTI